MKAIEVLLFVEVSNKNVIEVSNDALKSPQYCANCALKYRWSAVKAVW